MTRQTTPLALALVLALAAGPSRADALADAQAGMDALDNGNAALAIHLFTRFLGVKSTRRADQELAYVKRAQAHAEIGEVSLARQDLANARKLDPDDEDALNLLSQLRDDPDETAGLPPDTTPLALATNNCVGEHNDINNARYWCSYAAMKGDFESAETLGSFYLHIAKSEREYRRALRWFENSVETFRESGGSCDSTCNLKIRYSKGSIGMMYYQGQIGDQDYRKALYWLEQAAQDGDYGAAWTAGWICENGLAGAVNLDKARRWYTQAANAGNSDAKERLRVLGDQR